MNLESGVNEPSVLLVLIYLNIRISNCTCRSDFPFVQIHISFRVLDNKLKMLNVPFLMNEHASFFVLSYFVMLALFLLNLIVIYRTIK